MSPTSSCLWLAGQIENIPRKKLNSPARRGTLMMCGACATQPKAVNASVYEDGRPDTGHNDRKEKCL